MEVLLFVMLINTKVIFNINHFFSSRNKKLIWSSVVLNFSTVEIIFFSNSSSKIAFIRSSSASVSLIFITQSFKNSCCSYRKLYDFQLSELMYVHGGKSFAQGTDFVLA